MRWLWAAVLLLVLLTSLEARKRPRRGRLSGAGRSSFAAAAAGGGKKQRKQQRRGEITDNSAPPFLRSRVSKARTSSKEYATKLGRQQRRRKDKEARKRFDGGKDICLFKALKRCGRKVIKKFSTSTKFGKRCTTKEKFLDCMSLMQRRGCKAKGRRRGPARRRVRKYQRRLQSLLSTTRGCVIGVDLSAAQRG